ncbi:hypothetical protein GQ53DRAFT_845288 [Thozetella sp. PMI_491]|nr:hypothetical protein GQ53DRAFT_845288 [Thozetella sp. PMI_491]
MEARTDEEFEAQHGFTREKLRAFKEKQKRGKFAMHFAAFLLDEAANVEESEMMDYLETQEQGTHSKAPGPCDSHIKWMRFHGPADGRLHFCDVLLDSGAEYNFMPAAMAYGYSLRKRALDLPAQFETYAGEFTCAEEVEVRCVGPGDEIDLVYFYVLPEDACASRPALGRQGKTKIEHRLWDEDPSLRRLAGYTAMSSRTDTKELRRARDEAMEDKAKLMQQKKMREADDTRERKGSSSKSSKDDRRHHRKK